MKQFKRIDRKFIPLHFKLLWYFLLFGLIILIVLWVFNAFFIETFYTTTKSSQVEKNASIISKSIEENKNVQGTIESVASYNSLNVYLYDTTSLFTQRYYCSYDSPQTSLNFKYHDVYGYYNKALENDGKYMAVTSSLSGDLERIRFESIINRYSTSDTPQTEIIFNNNTDKIQNMVYAHIISLQDGGECMLIVTSSITPLSNTVEIIKDELMVVSIVFVLLAIIFSLFASRRIARPISKTNSSAKELAKKNYDVQFDATGYLEVEELNDTLEYAKNELATTERLQKELIANISHDLRTPLTMITGYGEVMRDLPGENTPENIQVIIDEATRLSSLVNDLLDLSKLQSGSIKPQKTRFSLTDSIKDIFVRYSKLKEQDGYNIEFKGDEDVYVVADELRISQVIYNLVNNAINYAGDDKTVIVTQIIKDGKVRIEVTDHGEGISAENLRHIWERYYKVDKQHKRGVIGTGLGLSIVKGILDSHNAHYGVKSTLGKGSTFWFELPID
ncbi:MAG: HAMP domain-containing histidine kinase [Ruminococcus sp.]|nr:HAMP domain-containing histidine kinase [Ruminococcus sp.]